MREQEVGRRDADHRERARKPVNRTALPTMSGSELKRRAHRARLMTMPESSPSQAAPSLGGTADQVNIRRHSCRRQHFLLAPSSSAARWEERCIASMLAKLLPSRRNCVEVRR